MVSEADILTSFLLERTDIKDALPKERFKRMFPKNTPDTIIKEARQILIKRMDHRLAMVNSNIHEWEEIQEIQATKTTAENDETLDGTKWNRKLKAKKAAENLSKISALLDTEIEELNSVYDISLEKLKQEMSSLNDIAYPTQKETALQGDIILDIVGSLDKFKKS